MNLDFLNKVIKKEFSTSKFALIKEIIGTTHLVYKVKINDSLYVVRIAKKKHKTFDTEIWALKQFEKWKVPGPKLIASDNSRTTIDSDYTILTFIEADHPQNKNLKGFESLSKDGLSLIHKRNILDFGPINGKGKGTYQSWKKFIEFKFNKANPNLKSNNILSLDILGEINSIWEKMTKKIDLKKGKLLLGDLHNRNFFVKKDKFYSFIDYKSILSGDPLWDYALIYYYSNLFIWPKNIKQNQQNEDRFYFYCLLICQNKIWYVFKKQGNISSIKKKLFKCIQKLI